MKAQIRRQVEEDMQMNFDSKFEEMKRNLQERDDKINQLSRQYSEKEQEKLIKEKEIKKMHLEFEKNTKL